VATGSAFVAAVLIQIGSWSHVFIDLLRRMASVDGRAARAPTTKKTASGVTTNNKIVFNSPSDV
jgi:hypothetical protein